MKKVLKIVIITFLVPFALFTLLILFVYLGAFGHVQNKEELLNYRNSSASQVFSTEGELIGKFYYENRTNVTYQQFPEHLINALLATEDIRFFDHQGIDWRSLARVLLKTLLLNNSGSGGGSTITQQLAKNMFGREKNGGAAIVVNKIRESILSNRLEKYYTKEEILTLYLNTVSFGENTFGIDVAALRYFNKTTEHLKIEESALLIGMLKATTYYNPVRHSENALKRRNIVLSQMEKYNYLRPSTADSLRNLPLRLDYNKSVSAGIADYFLIQVKNELNKILKDLSSGSGKKWDPDKDGLLIETTLSLTLQKFVQKAFNDHLSVMQKRLSDQFRTASGEKILEDITGNILKEYELLKRADEKIHQRIFEWKGSFTDSITVRDSVKYALTLLHAGLIAMDARTGAVRAWAGGIDFATQQYDQILARRQLGSVFKPILYSAALEEGMEPCMYLDNDSIVIEGYENWSPENFNRTYGGKYSLTGALVQSMNIPTFNLFLKVGFEKLDSIWIRMGFTSPLPDIPALPLGIAEASIREVAVAYSALANGGYKVTPQFITSVTSTDGEIIYQNDLNSYNPRILSERTSLLMSAILRKAVGEGTGASLKNRYAVSLPIAGKTGTSQNYADAWFAAFNPGLVIVTRVGASSPFIHFNTSSNGTGSALALPLAALTLKQIESSPEIIEKYILPFPDLPPELAGALDCPDFKEDNFFDKLFDLFKKKQIVLDEIKREKRIKKRRPFTNNFIRRKRHWF